VNVIGQLLFHLGRIFITYFRHAVVGEVRSARCGTRSRNTSFLSLRRRKTAVKGGHGSSFGLSICIFGLLDELVGRMSIHQMEMKRVYRARLILIGAEYDSDSLQLDWNPDSKQFGLSSNPARCPLTELWTLAGYHGSCSHHKVRSAATWSMEDHGGVCLSCQDGRRSPSPRQMFYIILRLIAELRPQPTHQR